MTDAESALDAALAHHRAGRLDDAATAYERLIAENPRNVRALHYLGALENQRRRPARALELLGQARRLAPRNPSLLSDLATVSMTAGRLAEATQLWYDLIDLAGEHPDVRFNLGLTLERRGFLEQAEGEYRRVLKADPSYVKAALRLAGILEGRGESAEAGELYEEARTHHPDSFEALLGVGRTAGKTGQPDRAREALDRAVTMAPAGEARAHLSLSRLLEEQGDTEGALAVAQDGTAHSPRHDLAWRQLGQVLKRAGRLDDAVGAFGKAHALLRTPGSSYGLERPEFRRTTLGKLRHAREQLEYLAATGAADRDYSGEIADYAAVLETTAGAAREGTVFNLAADDLGRLRKHYNRCLQRREAPALDGGALNPDLDAADITGRYLATGPGIVWIDDFLRPEALEALRTYLLESTIWYDAEHPNGYVGTYLHDGFDCPLIRQVAAELRQRLPDIFGESPLLQLWAYQYDSRLSGIDMHADFAAVNVNFWITPDEANLDPESGGMVVWDVEAPADWDFTRYNTAGKKQEILDFLEAEGARPIRIPHRQNRVVIFNSDLFHRTDDIRFREGFENRRINVTMLYGRRHDA